MKKIIKDKNRIENILTLFAWIILGAFLIYYIMIGCRSVLNSDSSFIVDYSLEQINTKRLFPTNWVESNDFWIYSLIPLITPLIKCGFSLLIARQTAVLIQSVMIFFLLFKIFYNKIQKYKFLIPTLIFLSGISGQMLFEVFGDATYGSIIFFMLLILYLSITYLNTKLKGYLVCILVILSFITTCSLRFPIYVTAPLIICLLYLFYKEKMKKEYLWLFGVLIVSSIIGLIGHKYLIANLDYAGLFGDTIIGNSTELSNNFHNFEYQYLWLFGATNTNLVSLTKSYMLNISNTSPMVAFSFLRFIVALFTLSLPIILLKKFKSFVLKEKVIFIYIMSLFVIIIFFLLIGNMASWYRYLSPVIFFLLLLYYLFYKYFITNKKDKIVFCGILLIFCLYSLFINISSYYSFEEKRFLDNPSQNIADFLVEHDLSFGFEYTGKEHNIYNLLSNGQVRIVRIAKDGLRGDYWLASKNWFDSNYHTGKTFFIRDDIEETLFCENEAVEKLDYYANGYNHYIFVFENDDCFQKVVKGTNKPK